MRQATVASAWFERFGKTTRRAAFLAERDQVVPWKDLCQLIEPVYPVNRRRRITPLIFLYRIDVEVICAVCYAR
jgi:hypothetical protein